MKADYCGLETGQGVNIPFSRLGAATAWGCPLWPDKRSGPGQSGGFVFLMTQKLALAWQVNDCVSLQRKVQKYIG